MAFVLGIDLVVAVSLAVSTVVYRKLHADCVPGPRAYGEKRDGALYNQIRMRGAENLSHHNSPMMLLHFSGLGPGKMAYPDRLLMIEGVECDAGGVKMLRFSRKMGRRGASSLGEPEARTNVLLLL